MLEGRCDALVEKMNGASYPDTTNVIDFVAKPARQEIRLCWKVLLELGVSARVTPIRKGQLIYRYGIFKPSFQMSTRRFDGYGPFNSHVLPRIFIRKILNALNKMQTCTRLIH